MRKKNHAILFGQTHDQIFDFIVVLPVCFYDLTIRSLALQQQISPFCSPQFPADALTESISRPLLPLELRRIGQTDRQTPVELSAWSRSQTMPAHDKVERKERSEVIDKCVCRRIIAQGIVTCCFNIDSHLFGRPAGRVV